MSKIKSVSTYIIAEHTPEEGLLTMYEERDEQGNILLHEQYYEDGSTEMRTMRQFDNDNRLLTLEQYSSNEKPDQRFEYQYNESGKVAKVSIHYLDGSISVQHYERDEAENSLTVRTVDEDGDEEAKEYRRLDSEGRVLEEIIHEDGELQRHVQSSYDDHGRLLSRHTKTGDGYDTKYTYEYEIDDQGRITGIDVVDEEDELVRGDTLGYDERGNEISHLVENHLEGYIAEERAAYDENGRLVKEQRFNGQNLASEVDYLYNENNLLHEEAHRSPRGVYLNQYKYEFYPA
ncbi:MAG: hypothetical protein AAGG75_10105 [Bacteroidota bacterium]